MDKALAHSALALLCRVCHAEEATFWEPSPDGSLLTAKANEGLHPERVEGFEAPVASSLIGFAWSSGQWVSAGEGAGYDPSLGLRSEIRSRAMMAAPVPGAEGSLGVLSAINPRGREWFDSEDLRCLSRWAAWFGHQLQPLSPESVIAGVGLPVDLLADVRRAAGLEGWDLMHQGTPGRTEDGPDPSIFRSGRGLPKVARGEVQLRLQPFLPILERLAGGTSGAAGTFRAEDFLAALPDPGAAEGLQRVARVQDLIDHGEYFKAADQVDALSLGERPPELLRLKALALARAGSADEAQSLLEGLLGCAPAGLEAHGLLARVAKDRWEKSEEGAASPLLLECIQRYEAAYALDPNHWPAINVATLSQVAGRTEAAERWGRLAQEAAAGILRQDPRDLWAHATLGEFHLLRQEDREAATHYAEAFPQTRAALLGSRASARRNARWLLKAQGRSLGTLDTLLPPPRVVVSSGHMQDTPDREPPRFPPHLMDPVRAALGAWLDATPVDYGFASGANGSDLLLLDLFAQRGIPFTVILPTDSNFFTPVSVGEAWLPLFDRVLAQAEKVHVISQGGDPLDPALLSFSLRVMLGLALWKAQNLEGCLESWAVWDPASKGGPGGTAEFLGRSRDLNIPSRYLDLRPLRRGSVSDPQPVDPSAITPLPDWLASEQRIHFFLFADLAGFSKLTEREVQAFVHHGLGLVGRLRTRHERAITVANTWGDGLFIVFKTLEAAVSFSQDLLKEWASDAWPRALLPEHAQWRISLHAGGLHHAEDPVARRPSAFGKPLVRAARMEPITPPGSAYLSLEFAALMMAADLPGYALDYAGELSLVKQAGQFPIFRLRSLA